MACRLLASGPRDELPQLSSWAMSSNPCYTTAKGYRCTFQKLPHVETMVFWERFPSCTEANREKQQKSFVNSFKCARSIRIHCCFLSCHAICWPGEKCAFPRQEQTIIGHARWMMFCPFATSSRSVARVGIRLQNGVGFGTIRSQGIMAIMVVTFM